MKKLLLFLLSGCSAAVVAATGSGPSARWIWYPETFQDRTTRVFRFAVDVPPDVKSAELFAAADDMGEFFLNGEPVGKPFSLKATKFEFAGRLKPGCNIFAFKVRNAAWKAGLIVRGEIIGGDGREVLLRSDRGWKSFRELPPGWSSAGFDDSGWPDAKDLGDFKLEPWNSLMDTAPFRDPGDCGFSEIPPESRGLLMLDDFSDVSSWMGGPVRGHRKGHNVMPFQLGFGAGPDASRADGGTGMIDFDFVEPGGVLRFEKNAVHQNSGRPEAIEFDADPQGAVGTVAFELTDRRNKPIFATSGVRLSGSGWRRCRLELNSTTVKGYGDMLFPISIRRLIFTSDAAGKGRILLDDLAFVVDLAGQAGQIGIRPEYRKLAHAADEPVELAFRIRNGLGKKAAVTLVLSIYDFEGRELLKRKHSVEIAPRGLARVAFDAGSYRRKGPYRIALAADNGAVAWTFHGWFGVFEPNRRRINSRPMWFGIEDQEIRNFQYEMLLHLEWMKLLGVDLARGGLIGAQFDDVRGSTFGAEQYAKMWAPYQEAGIDLLIDYAGTVPGWTGRPLASKPEFGEHIASLAGFMAGQPRVRYLEWFNEPNLGFFHGSISEYLASLNTLYPIVKALAPQVKVTTGGLVVDHASAKPDFARRTYQEASYDIACYHGHENYRAYTVNTGKLEKWLAEVGRAARPIGNSEAGFRSHHGGPELFRTQAVELVQKISFTKSRNSEYYIWFMLHDYGDKYIDADDSFGLVTVDNQPKPSFLAYNELIRQLADSDPAGAVELDARLETFGFRHVDGMVFVSWPRRADGAFTFALRTESPVTRIDLFGNAETLMPRSGVVCLKAGRDPFYIRASAGVQSVGTPLAAVGDALFFPGESGKLTLEVRNPYAEPVSYTLIVGGRTLTGKLAPGSAGTVTVAVEVSSGALPGPLPLECGLTLKNGKGTEFFCDRILVPCFVALPLGAEPARVTLDGVEQVRELMFDPKTPKWRGPEDLRAVFDIRAADGKLRFEVEVSDDDHCVPGRDIYVWRNDCVQIGVANAAREHYEFTVSGNGDGVPTVWCHISPGDRYNGRWEIPATVTRSGGGTVYRFEVPAAKLGLTATPGEAFRLAFLVNDNDGGRNLRFMEWNSGIQPSKNIDLFGWAKVR